MYGTNYADNAQLVNVLPTAARTSTANGSAIDLNALDGEVVLVLDSAAGTGTSPTLDLTLEESVDGSTGWAAVPAAAIGGGNFAQVVNAASRQIRSINVAERRRFIRAVSTIGGTTPSFTFSLNAVGVGKYY